ncbi:MAG: hypothetical protein FJ023_06305 [Chloroflexi bacterium]|nr:hypothetical protein [Chloroflexota bacterium]
MSKNKKIWFLLPGLIGLLLSSLVACGNLGYTTYTNEQFGYTISCPYTWYGEVSTDGTKCLISDPGRGASVMIDVAKAMPPKVAANFLIMSISEGTLGKEVTMIEDKPMQGSWDWYLSYDYEMTSGIFHGEAYFKQTEEHIYKLDTAALKEGYSRYPFSTIISSFKLQ